jgi:hypothetical protein
MKKTKIVIKKEGISDSCMYKLPDVLESNPFSGHFFRSVSRVWGNAYRHCTEKNYTL